MSKKCERACCRLRDGARRDDKRGRFPVAVRVAPLRHDWQKSQLGHGETMCARCLITNREAAILGLLDECPTPPAPPSEPSP